ncbi:MAG: DUF3311 domain-containing protein [Gemmatimonadetes bacterium]|nr:DUF3311 domain-containing protein [Gemmatimonadota bacterium]
MTLRAARWLVILYLVALAVALTFPAVVPFNRVRPHILGMPFVMFWSAAWVALGAIVLFVLERAESRRERAGERRVDSEPRNPA